MIELCAILTVIGAALLVALIYFFGKTERL